MKTIILRFAQAAIGVLVVMGLVGCALIFEEDPPWIEARFKASSDLNPDPQGRPSPLVLRLYELKSTTAFENTDFFSLYEDDASVLGEDMVAKDEFQFEPGETRELARELQPGTRYIGLLAAYRKLGSARWRAIVETPKDQTTEMTIRLEALGIKVIQK